MNRKLTLLYASMMAAAAAVVAMPPLQAPTKQRKPAKPLSRRQRRKQNRATK